MSWIDIVITVVFAIYLFEGFRRGFVEQTLELFGFFVTILLAFWNYLWLANWLGPHLGVGQLSAEPVAFLLDWVVSQAFYSLVLYIIHPFLPEKLRGQITNKLFGLVPAWFKAYIVVSLIVMLVVLLPSAANLRNDIDASRLGGYFANRSIDIENYLNSIFGRNVGQSLSFITVPPQNEQIIAPDQKVQLDFKTTNAVTDTTAEQKMLVDVNNARAQAGLPALVWDDKLATVARAHSTDMFAKGYFSHQDNAGGSPFDRMNAAGITYTSAGENIAFAGDEQLAFNGLMNSPEHRANILETKFGRVGIGVIKAGNYGEMFTQDFTN